MKGYTTGTCAQAAAKAAAEMLSTKKTIKTVEVETPAGMVFKLKVMDQEIGEDFARCAVVKNSGDESDATDGAKISAKVRFSAKKGIRVTGGEGVGKVTKPGLPVAVGEKAINPVPKQMIIKELTPHLAAGQGLEAIISVPEGEKLAKRTFNSRMGIVKGISIIGTTGIVEPKSTPAYQASLSLQLEVLKAAGRQKAALVLGYVGEKFCRKTLKLAPETIIKIGDEVGFMLAECVKKKIKEVFLAGYLGKLIKLVNGQFNTHIKFGDRRIKTIAGYARSGGAKKEVIKKILAQTSAEAAVDILIKNGLSGVFNQMAQDVLIKIRKFTRGRLLINLFLLSLEGEVLAAYE